MEPAEELDVVMAALERVATRASAIREEVMRALSPASDAAAVRRIQEVVAQTCGMSVGLIISSTRREEVVAVRWVAMLIADDHEHLTTTQMATLFMMKNHTTVVNIRKMGRLRIRESQRFAKLYDRCSKAVNDRLYNTKDQP